MTGIDTRASAAGRKWATGHDIIAQIVREYASLALTASISTVYLEISGIDLSYVVLANPCALLQLPQSASGQQARLAPDSGQTTYLRSCAFEGSFYLMFSHLAVDLEV